MAILTPFPLFRAFDGNGDPLAGGQLQTWIAGTTTPKATFTDQGGGTPNTNPVILNANGEADVWLATDSLYRMELRSSVGVLQWDRDNIGEQILSPQIATAYGIGSQVVRLTSQAGDTQLKATAIIPANTVLISGMIYVETTFGNGQGLTGLSVGTESAPERYGRGLPRTATAKSGPADYRNYVLEPTVSAIDLLVSAETGPFDGTGSLLLTALWETHTAAETL